MEQNGALNRKNGMSILPENYLPSKGNRRSTVAGNSRFANGAEISSLSDDELWERTRIVAWDEHAASCDLVELLVEMDKRNLPLMRMEVSLYDYCVHYLHFTEEAAYRRIRAARAIRKFPPISVMLREGKLTIETVALLHPYLDRPEGEALVTKCLGLRKWQVQRILAGLQPNAPQRDVVRVIPPIEKIAPPVPPLDEPLLDFSGKQGPSQETAPAISAPPPTAAPAPAAASPAMTHAVRVSFSADADFHRLMLRAKSLLRHKYPYGRLEDVLKDALIALLRKKDRGFRWQE